MMHSFLSLYERMVLVAKCINTVLTTLFYASNEMFNRLEILNHYDNSYIFIVYSQFVN